MKCSICHKPVPEYYVKRKGGVDVRISECCGIKRIREVKRTETDLVKGYDACKVWA